MEKIKFLDSLMHVYNSFGLTPKNLVKEIESQEYLACTFEKNNKIVKFRLAKITPKKAGQFVTLWKRIKAGSILPYDLADKVDLFVVGVQDSKNLGQFIFPKAILHQKGIVSKDGKGGKLGFRIYPPWSQTESLQAKKTQTWQLEYFFDFNLISKDQSKIKRLFDC